MNLAESSVCLLNQLFNLLDQLNDEQYAEPLDLLLGSSIGMHARHIVEFYDCLLKQSSQEVVNYDLRERNKTIETDKFFARGFIADCIHHLKTIASMDKQMTLHTLVDSCAEHSVVVQTSLQRELAYNVEHTIHHLAIIRIAIRQCFKEIQLEENFGIAYSTIIYQQAHA